MLTDSGLVVEVDSKNLSSKLYGDTVITLSGKKSDISSAIYEIEILVGELIERSKLDIARVEMMVKVNLVEFLRDSSRFAVEFDNSPDLWFKYKCSWNGDEELINIIYKLEGVKSKVESALSLISSQIEFSI